MAANTGTTNPKILFQRTSARDGVLSMLGARSSRTRRLGRSRSLLPTLAVQATISTQHLCCHRLEFV